jgi:hypothetical protein
VLVVEGGAAIEGDDAVADFAQVGLGGDGFPALSGIYIIGAENPNTASNGLQSF